MGLQVRDNVPALTGVLTVVSLALVFAAVLEAVPRWLLPRNELLIQVIPHLNAAIAVAAIGTIVAGVRAIRRGNIRRHRQLMTTALGLFAGFLVLYLYRVALEGPTPFTGPDVLALYVYWPVLAIHILLAVVCIPLLYYVTLLALSRPVSELPDTAHPRLGRITAVLWSVSFALGLVVYGLLHGMS